MSISAGLDAWSEGWVGLAVGDCCEGKALGCWAMLVVNLCAKKISAASKNSLVSVGVALRPLTFVMAARRAEPSAWILA